MNLASRQATMCFTSAKIGLRGIAKDQDIEDNSDIAALKHDCWTYAGAQTSLSVELHSSWDAEIAMHCVPAGEADIAFLAEHQISSQGGEGCCG